MKMKIETRNNVSVAIADKDTADIKSVQDALDLMVDALYNGCIGLMIYKETLD